jgi:hypothetical protein
MLIIRDSQMRALAEREKRVFTEATTASVAARWPEQFARLGADGVGAAVRDAIARCEGYGIDEPDDVAAFVAVMFSLGDLEFDRRLPWAQSIVRDPRLDGALKCRELEDGAARALAPQEDEDEDEDEDGGAEPDA